MGTDPQAHLRPLGCLGRLRRTLVVHGPRTAAVAVALGVAAACASVPGSPESGSGFASRSASASSSSSARPSGRATARPSLPAFLTASAPASQSGSGLGPRLLDAQSAPSGYQVQPASAFAVPAGSASRTPACSSAALGSPYSALTTVSPVEVAERGIDGPDESSGFFWRATEQLLGYQGGGAQKALTALRQWVAQCTDPQPGGNPLNAPIGTGPKLGDESLTLHVSMNVQTSSGAAVAPFDSIIVRTGTVVFVLSEQGVPATSGSTANAARLTAVADAAYARFQHP